MYWEWRCPEMDLSAPDSAKCVYEALRQERNKSYPREGTLMWLAENGEDIWLAIDRKYYKYESDDRQGSLKKPTHECTAIHAQKVVCVCRFSGFKRKTNVWIKNTYVKLFSVFRFYLHVYETEHICGSWNTSVNPFADHEIQVWILLCACVYYETVLSPYTNADLS